jgi:D-tyrosyl-tRNA(Tyr) deacylase
MRALVQRVTRARCTVGGHLTGEIGAGLAVLLGAAVQDAGGDADWLAHKVAGLRLFGDEQRLMNRDVREIGGAALVIPQFTLYGDVRHGRRPDFTRAARPELAEPLFERFCEKLAAEGVPVARGVFRAHMEIELLNDGPVTLMIESPRAGAALGGADSPVA